MENGICGLQRQRVSFLRGLNGDFDMTDRLSEEERLESKDRAAEIELQQQLARDSLLDEAESEEPTNDV